MTTEDVQINFRADQKWASRVRKEAKKRGMTVTEFIKRCVDQELRSRPGNGTGKTARKEVSHAGAGGL